MKHVIRIPPLKAGRRVRWTLEVSADVDGENAVHTTNASKTKATKKAKRSKPKSQTPRAASPRRKTPAPSSPVAAIARTETPTDSIAVAMIPAATASDRRPDAPVAAQIVTPPAAVGRNATRSHAIALAAIAAVILAALAVPRYPVQADARVEADPGSEAQNPSSDREAVSLPVVAAPPRVPTPEVAPPPAPIPEPFAGLPAASGAPKKTASKPAMSLAAALPTTTTPVPPAVETRDKEEAAPTAEPTAAPAPAAPATEIAALAPVTITGCLEVSTDDDRFRLTDTEGAGAPKARSWRTGFLKKRSAPVDLVGPPEMLALQRQVGMRVAATGTLASRELRVSAVRVVSSSCN